MRRLTTCAFLTLALLSVCTASAAPPANVVLIVGDDIRHDDLVHMPRVSELAAQGVQFDAAFSPIALCVPARVSLLTGTLPRTHGIRDNRGQDFVPSDTIATRLDAAGYEPALFGKYLNASRRPSAASAQRLVIDQPPGWDVFRALLYHDDYGREQPDVLLQQAQAFMSTATGPFFVYLAPTAAHGPLSGPPRCDAREIPPPPPGATEKRWRQRVSALCGLDDLVADIVASRGPDTWVLWTADHGFMLGEGGRTGKSELVLDAAQVPLIVWGPDVVPARRREIVSLVDVSATVLRLANVGRSGLEGQSFLPLLRGDSSQRWTGTLEIIGQ